MDILVSAGNHRRQNCPVDIIVPKQPDAKSVKLREEDGSETIAQYKEENDKGLISFILTNLNPKEQRKYKVEFSSKKQKPKVEIGENDNFVEVKLCGELLTKYHFKEVVRPYLYPFIGPNGKSILRNYPMVQAPGDDTDHPHHKGIWTAHGDVNKVDNWSEEQGCGFVIHQNFEELFSGSVFGKITGKNNWVSKDKEPVLEEIRTMKFYNIRKVRLFDLEINFNARFGDVLFGDTKEGGIISIRVASQSAGIHGGKIENSIGAISEKECWGKKAEWCDYSGKIDSDIVGTAFFDNPTNLRFPTYWHVREGGWMCANVFGISYFENTREDFPSKGNFLLKKGEQLTFKYRAYIHKGDAKEGKVSEAYVNYVIPPEVKVI